MDFKVGDKVRIVKCMVYFCPVSLLGKVDTIIKIDDQVHLEKYNVPSFCIEKVENDAVDVETEYNENLVYKPDWKRIL